MTRGLTLVLEELNSSGGVRVLTAVANVAADAGCAVDVLVPSGGPEPFYAFDPRARIRPVATLAALGRPGYLCAVACARLRSETVFMTSSYRLLDAIAPAAVLGGRPSTVLLVQGHDRVSLIDLAPTPPVAKAVNKLLLSLSYRLPARRVFVSNHLATVYPVRGSVLPNFVAKELLDSAPRTTVPDRAALRIGCACTATPNKGFDLVLQAARRLAQTRPPGAQALEFVCATQDPALRQAAPADIAFVAPRTDAEMGTFYRSCDVFLSLSVSEGFGLPALEAMACGCTVICTDSGGVRDFLRDGENGVLLRRRSGTAVAEAVDRLATEPALRARLTDAGRRTAQQYSPARFAERYRHLFTELGLLNG